MGFATSARISAALGLVTLAGCLSGVPEAVLPQTIVYRCTGGKELVVNRAPDGREVSLDYRGRHVNLPRAPSAAQEKYAGQGIALYLDEDRASLEAEGRLIFGPCQSTVPIRMAPRQRG